MTTQTAEQLAAAIVSNTEPLGRWTSIVDAAAMLRSQAAEIERLRTAMTTLLANPTSKLMQNIARAALEKQA